MLRGYSGTHPLYVKVVDMLKHPSVVLLFPFFVVVGPIASGQNGWHN